MKPDGWMDGSRVWGIALRVERGNHVIGLTSDRARRHGLWIARARHTYCRMRNGVYGLYGHMPEPVRKTAKRLIKGKK